MTLEKSVRVAPYTWYTSVCWHQKPPPAPDCGAGGGGGATGTFGPVGGGGGPTVPVPGVVVESDDDWPPVLLPDEHAAAVALTGALTETDVTPDPAVLGNVVAHGKPNAVFATAAQ